MTLAQWIDPDDASQIDLDGDEVRSILDKSGNANHLYNTGRGVLVANFNDQSPNNAYTSEDIDRRTATFLGGTFLDTSQKKFGSASLYTAADSPLSGITFPDSEDWNFGSGNFTVECWVRWETGGLSATFPQTFFAQWPTGGSNLGWIFELSSATQIQFAASQSGTVADFLMTRSMSPLVQENVWHHFAATRTGNTVRLFIDGKQIGATGSLTFAVNDSTVDLAIGSRNTTQDRNVTGWIDSARILKGESLYQADFTPPTEPFGLVKSVIQGYANKSPGSDTLSFTNDGFLAAKNASPILANMDGPDFTASIAFNKDLLPSPIDGGKTIYGMRYVGSPILSPEDSNGWGIEDLGDADIFRLHMGTDFFDLVPVPDEEVSLLATFDGEDATTTYQSVDRYLQTCTFNQYGSGSELDTAEYKFTKSSLKLNGSGSVSFPNNDIYFFDGGDWTLEGWFKFNAATTASLICNWNTSGQRMFLFAWSAAGGFEMFISTNGSSTTQVLTVAQASWNPSPLDQWYHIACVRRGSTVEVFVDGVSVGSATTIGASVLHRGTETTTIGSHGANNFFNGWIDNVRITKGRGRYGGSPADTFPTTAFADTFEGNNDGVVTVVHDASNQNVLGYVNGKFAGGMEYTGTLGFANNVTLGGNELGSYLNGYLFESIYFDGVLSVDDIERVEGYMAHKWNFPANLPTTHPYRYKGPEKANSSYTETVLVANFYGDRDGHAGSPEYIAETGQTATFGGNASLDDNEFKFNASSLALDGTGDYLRFPDTADWDFGTGDFTVEAWVRFASTAGQQTIIGNWQDASTGWRIQWRTDTQNWEWREPGNTIELTASSSPHPETGRWYHIAVSRKGTDLRMFLDGVEIASSTNSNDISGSTRELYIGATDNTQQFVNGHIGPVRVIKGRAIYTRNFTVPARPFEVPQTATLIANFNGVDAVASPPGYTSEDASARTMNFIGNAQLDSAMKWSGVSSLKCDGSGDRVEIADTVDLEFGAGDFTVEAMVRWSTDPSTSIEAIVGKWSQNESPIDEREWLLYLGSNTLILGWTTDGSAGTFSTISIPFNPEAEVWYHIVVERHDDVVYFWINGAHQGSIAVTATFYTGDAPLVIGGNDEGTQDFTGWIDHVRIIKGYALRSTINPPQVPYSTVGEDATTIMVNFDGVSPATSYTTDDAYAIPLTFYNGAQISNVERYVGSSSLDAIAEADAVEIPQQSPEQFALGTDDFTIEFMCKFSAAPSTASYNAIIDQRVSGSVQVRPYIGTTGSGGQFVFYVNGVDRITGSFVPTTGQWYHVVVERAAGVTRMFVDGVEEGSGYTDSNNYLDGPWTIGSRWDQGSSNNSFEGYIDAFRVTMGRARYKGDFTVPAKTIGEPLV